MYNLRCKLFSRYQKFGKKYFDNSNKGHIKLVLSDFIDMIGRDSVKLFGCLEILLSLIFYLVIIFIISWEISLLVLLFFPLIHFILRKIIKKIKRNSRVLVSKQKDVSAYFLDFISNIQIVKTSSVPNKDLEKFKKLSNDVELSRFSQFKKLLAIQPLTELVFSVFLLFLCAAAVYMIIVWELILLSNFMVFLVILKKSSAKVHALTIIQANFSEMHGPLFEIYNVFNDDGKYFVSNGKKLFYDLQKNIEFKELSFSYSGDKKVLSGLNFSAEKGKTTAIVGKTGSGKTTLLNLVMRFYNIDQNKIFIDDVDINSFSILSLMGGFAYVTQDTQLFNDTLYNNLSYGIKGKISDSQINDAIKKAQLHDMIKNLPLGLNTIIGDKGIKLSGGERQRLAIARALLKNPKVLLLDEATSALDSKTESQVHDAISQAIKGRTAIIVAHRLSTIKNADKIIVLNNGKVAEQGSIDKLLKMKGMFYNMWNQQKFT